MLTCPECNISQSSNAPFCESCGYRFGKEDDANRHRLPEKATVRLQESARNIGSDTKREDSSSPYHAPTIRPSSQEQSEADQFSAIARHSPNSRTLVEGLEPVRATDRPFGPTDSRASQSSTRRGIQKKLPPRPPSNSYKSTMLEGMEPMTRPAHATSAPSPQSQSAPVEEGLEETTGPEEAEYVHTPLPIELSGLHAVQLPPQQRSKWLMIVALSSFVAAMLALMIYMALDRDGNKANAISDTVYLPSIEVAVPEGPFRRGLSEEVRSFLLQTCMKVHDDPDEACQESKLLTGEYPQRTVNMSAYRMDSKEVSGTDYQQCVKASACEPVNYRDCQVWTHQGLQVALRVPKVLQEQTRPVVCVTRDDARNYCAWKNGGLPTHDQWEKAARGEDGGLFPWGDMWISDAANWGEMDIMKTSVVGQLDGFEWTAPSGSYPDGTSVYEIYDMAGNVAEWVEGEDLLIGHVRGGSWTSTPFDLRTTVREEIPANDRRTNIGFRCVYSP